MGNYKGIEISKVFFRTFNGGGNLVAFADVVINGFMTLRGFRVIRRNDGNLFAAPPSTEKVDKETGEKKYFDNIGFPKEYYENKTNPFCDEIVKRFHAENGGSSHTASGGGSDEEIPF